MQSDAFVFPLIPLTAAPLTAAPLTAEVLAAALLAVGVPAAWAVTHFAGRTAFIAHAEAASPEHGEETPSKNMPGFFRPSPQCPECGHVLPVREQIPVIGWVLIGGHCTGCGVRVPVILPLIETLALVAGPLVIAGMAAFLPTASLPGASLPGAVILEGAIIFRSLLSVTAIWLLLTLWAQDALYGLVVDRLTFPLLWLGLIGAATGYGPIDAGMSILGAAAGWGLLRSGHLMATLRHGDTAAAGWGDMKMAAAAGAFLGPLPVLTVLTVATLIAAAMMGRTIFLRWGFTGAMPVKDQPVLRFAPILAPLSIVILLVGPDRFQSWVLNLPALMAGPAIFAR